MTEVTRYHGDFWVIVGAAAPVLMLAFVFALSRAFKGNPNMLSGRLRVGFVVAFFAGMSGPALVANAFIRTLQSAMSGRDHDIHVVEQSMIISFLLLMMLAFASGAANFSFLGG